MPTIKDLAPEAFDRLTRKQKRQKRKPKPGEVRINDQLARELMRHDCFYRGYKRAIRQKY